MADDDDDALLELDELGFAETADTAPLLVVSTHTEDGVTKPPLEAPMRLEL